MPSNETDVKLGPGRNGVRILFLLAMLLLVAVGSYSAVSLRAALINNRAMVALVKGSEELDDAVVLLAANVERTPSNPRLLTTLGRIYEAQGDVERAINAWERSFQLDGNQITGFLLGRIHEENGRPEKALAAWCRAVNPSLIAYFEKLQRKMIVVALSRCQVQRLSASDPAYWLYQGKAAEMSGRIDEALQAYARGLQLAPADYDLYFAKYSLEWHTRSFDAAIATALARLEAVPWDHRLPAQLANAYYYGGYYELARHWYEKAMARQPGYRSDFAYYACMASNALGDYPRAVDSCQQVIQYAGGSNTPDLWKYYAELSRAYEGLGEIEAAIEALRRSIEAQDRCSWQQELKLGELYEAAGDQAGARSAYQAALACKPNATAVQEALDALGR